MNERDVRPKGIGEILDRAIATYVRAFVPLFAIVAAIAIPFAIVQYALQPDATRYFEDLTRIVSLPPGDPGARARVLREANAHRVPAAALALFVLAGSAVFALARNALLMFAAGILDRTPVTIAAAYRAALARWVPQIVVILAFLGFGLVALAGLFVVTFVAALAIGAAALLSRLAAIVAAVPLGLAVAAAFCGAYALLFIAWQMATVIVATEDPNPVRAIGRGLRRTLDRALLRRTLLVGLCVGLLDVFGSLSFLACGALIAALTHAAVLAVVATAVGGIIIEGLRSLFVLVYTRDVRVRREGLDLLVAAGDVPAPA